MGSLGANKTSAVVYEKPVINTTFYKSTTQQMKDIVADTYADMQKEFPILSKAVTFDINNGGGFDAAGSAINLDGRYMKEYLKRDSEYNDDYYEMYLRGVIAHELVHTVQSRMGKAQAEEVASNILSSAVDKYVRDNAGTSKEQVLKDLKKAYGVRTLDSDATRRPMMERMAVAVQHYYLSKKYPNTKKGVFNKSVAHIGYYVADELKREIRR